MYIMFVWKDECGESVHIIVVRCDLSGLVCFMAEDRTSERTIECERDDEKQL